ncbi:MAG TPA: hypothetical protein VL120_04210 [Solirubrobacteraceae bacterium]|jgi:hypothetical protein|nr:hypothetical protein [Solirubrobacteraceae bacterium]
MPGVLSPTAPAQHALWRVAGEHAKGILYESGRVHTWPEAEASHGAVARDHVRRTGDHPIVCFLIRPDGTVTYAARYAAHAATLDAALRRADPTLTVVAPSRPAGAPGHPDAAVAAVCRWLEFGTPAARASARG